MRSCGSVVLRSTCLLIASLMLLPAPLAELPKAAAQVDPPPFGEGDWVINNATLVKDQVLRLKGNVRIDAGGSLTLENTTLLMDMGFPYTNRFEAMTGSSLVIKEDSFIAAFDARFALYIQPGADLRMQNSTISNFTSMVIGSDNAIIEDSTIEFMQFGISIWGGDVDIFRSSFDDNNDGIWNVYGNANIRDCHFLGNSAGYFSHGVSDIQGGEISAWAPSWFIGNSYPIARNSLIERNLFENSFWAGVQFTYFSPGTVRNNVFRGSNTYGVLVHDSDAYIEDNTFIDGEYGIAHSYTYIWSGTYYLRLKNNEFFNCWNYGVYSQNTSELHTEWTVEKEIYSDSGHKLRGYIEVGPGGHLRMNDTFLRFSPYDGSPEGVQVLSGGKVTFDNVTMGSSWSVSTRVFFNAETDTTVTVRNSTFDKVGYSWGTKGQWGGLFSEGELLVEDSVFDGGVYGIINGGGHALVRNVQIGNGSYGLFNTDGTMEVFDSVVSDTGVYDVSVTGGHIDLYNVTFDRSHYNVASGTMDVHWDCDLRTMWQNGNPVGNVTYDIREKDTTLVGAGTTDEEGISGRHWLREFTQTAAGAVETTPHNISGSVLGLTNSTLQKVKANTRLGLFIEDIKDPGLDITSPGLRVYTTNNTVFVQGTASDDESGLDKVRWSLDQDLWNEALGLHDWNFTVVLEYGTRSVFVEAVDKAGNTNTLRMVVTVDKDAPYLVVMSPKDGSVTPLRTTLVEGYAEMGSTVNVSGASVKVMDGTFRLSVDLVEGENVLHVLAMDQTGNTNQTSVTVFRDTTPPEIIVTSPEEDLTTNQVSEGIKVSGRTEPGALFYINGVSVQLYANGTFSFSISMTKGLNVINFLARDGVGNQNTTVRRVVYDLEDPPLQVYGPVDGLHTNHTTVQVDGLTEPSITVLAGTGAFSSNVTSNREGRFTMEVGLKEGSNDIKVTAVDLAGNTRERTLTVVRDTIAPKILLFNVFDGMVVDTSRFMLEGETETGAKVKLNNELLTVGVTGKFSQWLDMPSANNTFEIEVMDQAGNWNSTTITLKRKVQEPPKGPGVSARADYFLWILLVAIVILVVQWVVLFKRTKDWKDKGDEVEDIRPIPKGSRRRPSPGRFYPNRPKKGPGGRVQPKRQAAMDHALEEYPHEEDQEPEFEIEYGNGRDRGGGGQ